MWQSITLPPAELKQAAQCTEKQKECFSILQSCENWAACQPHRVCRTAHRKAKAGQEKWIKKCEHAFLKSLSRLAWNDSLGKDKSTCFSTRKCDHQDCNAQAWKTKELGLNEVVRKLSKDKNKMLHQGTPADAELLMRALNNFEMSGFGKRAVQLLRYKHISSPPRHIKMQSIPSGSHRSKKKKKGEGSTVQIR